MLQNLEATHGLVYSQRVLLALARKGLPRQTAYALVQRNAMRALDGGADFRQALGADADVTQKLDAKELDACFDLAQQLRHVDEIFNRVFPR
jgi:adenylosuccinate lyase